MTPTDQSEGAERMLKEILPTAVVPKLLIEKEIEWGNVDRAVQ